MLRAGIVLVLPPIVTFWGYISRKKVRKKIQMNLFEARRQFGGNCTPRAPSWLRHCHTAPVFDGKLTAFMKVVEGQFNETYR